jgi:hypothetical protein
MPPQGGSEFLGPRSTPSRLSLDPNSMSSSRLETGLNSIETALEASCATLVALERLRAFAANDPHRTAHLTREIDLIRGALEELRRAHETARSPLDYGFVLAEPDPLDSWGDASRADHLEVPHR